MSFNYLNAEQAIRVATAFREAVTKEGGADSYNITTLFVRPADLDIISERLGVDKQVSFRNPDAPISTVYWNDRSTGMYITFQAI